MQARALTLLALAGLVAPGCSCGPGSGLAITVTFSSSSQSRCVLIGANKELGGGKEDLTFQSKPLLRPADNSLIVGVERNAVINGKVVPFALGYTAADCTGVAVEQTLGAVVDLDLPGTKTATLVLSGVGSDGGVVDAGVADAGPPDGGCVASPELCTDLLDNDCDGLIDCGDPSCTAQGCNDNNACTSTDVCLADGGCGGAVLACSSPAQCEVSPGQCFGGVCAYDAGPGLPCNTNGVCRSDKSCADGGEVFCANAIDDDGDLATDCADSDCVSQACDAGPSTCFLAAVCQGTACAKTTPVVCTPPSSCFISTGACIEGTGCPFQQRAAGAVCDAGLCQPDGGCAPIEVCTNGVDDDLDLLADCADPDCNATACDDNNACTTGTVCSSGVCAGGAVCPSSFCAGPGTCASDGGGCQYPSPNLYARCDGGFCRSNGTCGAPFPFTPSNFNPNALTVPDASVSIDCVAEYNSDNNAFNGWCGPQPSVFNYNQPTGENVAVLVMPNLNVTDAGAIYLIGLRPVVFAVFGRAVVDGRIVAGPKPGSDDRGAGGSLLGVLAKAHCTTGIDGRGGTGVVGNNTSGGGGGGAYGRDGGSGGNGATLAGSGGPGGVANGNAEIIPLRGGCSGGLGGDFFTGAALGGYGGGAVQLSVAGSLVISGSVSAPGQAGNGANNSNDINAGGGGAGSGGAVMLEAGALRLFPTAAITAQGGGGGEGDGDPQGGEAGDAGQDGHVDNGGVALGGAGNSTRGGNGGNGGVRGTPALPGTNGTSASSRNGGGGGGGASVGRVRFNVAGLCSADAGTISPTFTGTCN